MLRPHHTRPGSYDRTDQADRPWILSLADDLTGALEVSAKFAAYGLQAMVTTRLAISKRPACDVLVIDTETRHVSEAEAYESVRQILVEASRFNPDTVYKKTDSTLRGNIAAELRALQSVFPARPLIYAPAYVAMGRTVRDGHLYIAGKLIEQTEFAHDPLNPVRESNIRALLNNESISVLDAESDEETRETVRLMVEADPKPLAAGPAALAEALAMHLPPGTSLSNPLPRIARCLVINGSLHARSYEQINLARSQDCFRDGWMLFEDSVHGTGTDRARQVGECVQDILRTSSF